MRRRVAQCLGTLVVVTAPTVGQGADAAVPPGLTAGNPLAAVTLDSLTETRARPLFSPSRRPPQPPPAPPPPPMAAPAPAPPPAPPPVPRLALLGTVQSGEGAIAVFMDQASGAIVRLRLGEAAAEWVLRSVDGRSATLEREGRLVTLSMPAPSSGPAPFGGTGRPIPGTAAAESQL